jgi:hypothetical protein
VKLADARDSKSRGGHPPCGFDSHLRHQSIKGSHGGRIGRLSEQFRTLQREFEALRSANVSEWAAFQLKLQEHRGLLANHHIALEWTLYPPCGRTSLPRSSRTTLFFTPAAPPRARAVAPQNEATDLTAA